MTLLVEHMQHTYVQWIMSYFILIIKLFFGTRCSVVGWHYTTSRKVAASGPSEVDVYNLPNISSRNRALGSTQPLTEMSTRNLPVR
jgi:hypothetical protein